MEYKNYSSFRQQWEKRNVNCTDFVKFYLKNISKKKELNAFIETFDKEAYQKAEQLDRSRSEGGSLGKLAGMVIGIKDLLCYKDHKLNAASKILDGFVSQFSATVVEKLLKEDAIIIGRLNCDQFGMGSSSKNSYFGCVKNSWDTDRVAGGSSGGSAVAVAADLCMASLGTDTGGSIRLPSSFCGVIGLKPTYSRVSRHGLVAFSSSFDTIGPITKNIEDTALLLEVIAGKDDKDSTVSQKKVPYYTKNINYKKQYKIGYFAKAIEEDGVQEEIKEAFKETISVFKKKKYEITPIEIPYIEYGLPTYYILSTAEASTNLSRYDGIRYGLQKKEGHTLEDMYKSIRSEGFGEEVKRRILLGTFVLSANYFDAFFTKAQKVRQLIIKTTKALLKEYDMLLLPTTPYTAMLIEEESENILQEYLTDIFTILASLTGTPAISFPVGMDKKKLPIGMQLIANSFEEDILFQTVKDFQKR